MATATHLPFEQYLVTSYHPDCDYIDGGWQERTRFSVADSPVYLDLAELFASLPA